MNMFDISGGFFNKAYYIERDIENNKYYDKRAFWYRTFDDNEFRTTQQQRQQGAKSSRMNVSVETMSQFDFKPEDKVEFPDERKIMTVSAVDLLKSTPSSMRNMLGGRVAKYIKRLHLNKEDI